MYFESLQAVIGMDGHGVFVWPAYIVTAVVIASIFIAPSRKRKRTLKELAGAMRRNETPTTHTGKVD